MLITIIKTRFNPTTSRMNSKARPEKFDRPQLMSCLPYIYGLLKKTHPKVGTSGENQNISASDFLEQETSTPDNIFSKWTFVKEFGSKETTKPTEKMKSSVPRNPLIKLLLFINRCIKYGIRPFQNQKHGEEKTMMTLELTESWQWFTSFVKGLVKYEEEGGTSEISEVRKVYIKYYTIITKNEAGVTNKIELFRNRLQSDLKQAVSKDCAVRGIYSHGVKFNNRVETKVNQFWVLFYISKFIQIHNMFSNAQFVTFAYISGFRLDFGKNYSRVNDKTHEMLKKLPPLSYEITHEDKEKFKKCKKRKRSLS